MNQPKEVPASKPPKGVTNYVLCRREISDFGEPKRFCCKPIKTKSRLNWCDEDLARLPFWP